MYYSHVKDIIPNNDQINVAFTVTHDEGEEETVVAELYQAFDASISKDDLEAELTKVALSYENDARQAQLRAVQEAKAENVEKLRDYFLGGQEDETA